MRQRIMIGILVILLAAAGYIIYRNTVSPVKETATAPGTVTIALDDEDLAKLKALNPQLTLLMDAGGKTPVLVWKIEKGRLVLQEFAGLQPTHYTALLVDYGAGHVEQMLIDVDGRTAR